MADTLLIAIGNPLRGDDGVAHRVLDLLGPRSDADEVRVHQLTPELAPEISYASAVVFIDADAGLGETVIEPISGTANGHSSSMTHSMDPNALIALARALCGFDGESYLCRVPGLDFGVGAPISPYAEHRAQRAVALLTRLLAS